MGPLIFRRRIYDYIAVIALTALVLMLIRFLGEDTTGKVYVIDGDSLRLGQTRIRLYGIDAPELSQTCKDASGQPYACGKKARQYLKRLIGRQTVTCRTVQYDRYGRAVSLCTAGKRELNLEMVKAGWAIAYLRHSHDYANVERTARKARRGIWQGHFTLPQDWRRSHPRQQR